MVLLLAWILLAACLLAIALVCGGYALLLASAGRFLSASGNGQAAVPPEALPDVTLIIVARNAEALIAAKLANSFSLDYPQERLHIIACSDGSTDRTGEIMAEFHGPRLQTMICEEHLGKIELLNRAAAAATTELLVFSDVDAILAPDALCKLLRHFADPSVGGVCGQRVIAGDLADLADAQRHYISLDSRVKLVESRLGRLSANDGKLYAVRRSMHQPIAQGVTDDLYACLSIIHAGGKFLFEPEAIAAIKVPSRSMRHELSRRQRIVTQSLRGIYLHRALLNPFRYGLFSLGLLINKVLRRMLPLLLLGILVATAVLAIELPVFRYLVLLQLVGYLCAPLALLLGSSRVHPGRRLRQLAKLGSFILVGNVGTLLGLMAFVSGQRVDKWEPVKSDR